MKKLLTLFAAASVVTCVSAKDIYVSLSSGKIKTQEQKKLLLKISGRLWKSLSLVMLFM